MSYSDHELREMLKAWAVWKFNGGWQYVEPMETSEGVKIRAPGTHSDPTLSHVVGMELRGDCQSATVQSFVGRLPRLRKALVHSTYYDPLVDRQSFVLSLVLRDYGISSRVYFDQMRASLKEFRWYLEELDASKEAA